MERRAVVLEVDGRRAVVLTETGEVRRIRVRRPGLRVGQELVLDERPAPVGRAAGVAVGAAAAAAAVGLALAVRTPAVPVAVVSVDVNPSLSLAVAADGRVTAVAGWDADGRALAAALASDRGRPLAAVAAALARVGRGRGFLGPSAWVLVAGAPEPGRHAPPATVLAAEQALAENVERVGDVPAAHVVVLPPASAATAARAADLALSLGRYLAAERAGLPVHEVRSAPVETLAQSLRRIAPSGSPAGNPNPRGEPEPERPAPPAANPPAAQRTGETGDRGGASTEHGPSSGKEPEASHAGGPQLDRSGGDRNGGDRGGGDQSRPESQDTQAPGHVTGGDGSPDGSQAQEGD